VVNPDWITAQPRGNPDDQPTELNLDRPDTGRMYDYFLGGKDNFAIDRAAAEEIIRVNPDTRVLARQNRAFVARAAAHCTRHLGQRQFLDIGTGLPTHPNVYETVLGIDPDARLIGVDNNPIVRAHDTALLPAGEIHIRQGDLRELDPLFALLAPLVRWDEPVTLILGAVMHFIPGDGAIVAAFRDRMAPGSCLVLSHATSPDSGPRVVADAQRVYDRSSAPFVPRGRSEIAALFDGFVLEPPGLVDVGDWRNDEEQPTPDGVRILGGVGVLGPSAS
jgi:S-adenosyl methyltransferase